MLLELMILALPIAIVLQFMQSHPFCALQASSKQWLWILDRCCLDRNHKVRSCFLHMEFDLYFDLPEYCDQQTQSAASKLLKFSQLSFLEFFMQMLSNWKPYCHSQLDAYHNSTPGRGESIVISVSVCLHVCLSIHSYIPKNHMPKLN